MRTAALQIVKKVTAEAAIFRQTHQADPAIGSTFGYFTSHPVAPLNHRRLVLILEAIRGLPAPSSRPFRVLDLACGGGLITCALAFDEHRALGIDLSEDEIRMAQLFAGERRLDGMFLRADLENDPTWEARVDTALAGKPDVVTLAYALHHLPKVEEFLARLSTYLPPGAVLVINEENPQSPLFRLKHWVRSWLQNDTDVEWHRTFDGWREVLQKHGFQVDSSPVGADPIPLLSRIAPLRCWSLVFKAKKV